MKLETIIAKIKDGFTGDNEKDTLYLMKQMEKYKDYKMAKEIIRECGRLMYERMPERMRPKIDQIIDDEVLSYDLTLQKVRIA